MATSTDADRIAAREYRQQWAPVAQFTESAAGE